MAKWIGVGKNKRNVWVGFLEGKKFFIYLCSGQDDTVIRKLDNLPF
jgi:hypothetical protein